MTKRIFISYRRVDALWPAKDIFNALCKQVPEDNIFMDVNSIPLGADFRRIIKGWVADVDIMLALIGHHWIDAIDPTTGRRRLEDENDFVRLEIGEALLRDIPVVPILLDGTPMPTTQHLPDNLKDLSYRNAEKVDHLTFEADIARLIGKLGLDSTVEVDQHVQFDLSKFEPPRGTEAYESYLEAKEGETIGLYNLAWAYKNGKDGVEQNYFYAKAIYERVAAEGDDDALFALGLLYDKGDGVPQDYKVAKSYYERAAEKGNAKALYNLGFLYDEGQGVPQDYSIAKNYYERAAEKGSVKALYNLGYLYDVGQGVPQDYALAKDYYERAAEKGNAKALHNLGLLYDNAKGVPQDYALAKDYYERAAENGSAFALNNLGVLYKHGRGVTKDLEQARSYYEKAADLGSKRAKENLKKLDN